MNFIVATFLLYHGCTAGRTEIKIFAVSVGPTSEQQLCSVRVVLGTAAKSMHFGCSAA